MTYNMGINGDTSRDIAARWKKESKARSRNAGGMFIFSFGFNDAAKMDGNPVQVDLETSVEIARSMLSQAREISQVLWIGPTPLDERVNPMRTQYNSWEMCNDRIAQYDEAYDATAKDLSIPYLRLFPAFLSNQRYGAALLDGDKVHPGKDGHQMISERLFEWADLKTLLN
jgi:lysophospholipase L1-like esterase